MVRLKNFVLPTFLAAVGIVNALNTDDQVLSAARGRVIVELGDDEVRCSHVSPSHSNREDSRRQTPPPPFFLWRQAVLSFCTLHISGLLTSQYSWWKTSTMMSLTRLHHA